MRTTEQSEVVVFASGRGSNFRALCEAARSGRLPARIRSLVTNVCGAGACQVAREFGIPVLEIASKGRTREEHEELVARELEKLKPDWLVLAGYMRLFTPGFVRRFWDDRIEAARMINIHPSLLPSFAGTDGYGQALRYGVKVTGATVHLVGTGLDDGPIVAQRALEVRDDDTEASLSERGLKLEHDLYVEALTRLFGRQWKVSRGTLADGRPRVVFSEDLK